MTKNIFTPKAINQQTIVITGATSGIGLATARLACEQGARVVMSSRHAEQLDECVRELEAQGAQVIGIEADVSKSEDLRNLCKQAILKFGQIDTWINNAGTSIFGYLQAADQSEERKLFETNFWGVRMGSALAVEAMAKSGGGTLINLGSEVSVAPQPLLGMYSASKHAVKAFTEALRSELRDQNIPVEVCLIRPTAIDTPFPDHGANRLMDGEPSLPKILYDPKIAAQAIIKCAQFPQRDVYVGGPARLSAILDTFFPKLKDIYAESQMKQLKRGTGVEHSEDHEGLHHASTDEGHVHGKNEGKKSKSSLYTTFTTTHFMKSLTDNLKKGKLHGDSKIN